MIEQSNDIVIPSLVIQALYTIIGITSIRSRGRFQHALIKCKADILRYQFELWQLLKDRILSQII